MTLLAGAVAAILASEPVQTCSAERAVAVSAAAQPAATPDEAAPAADPAEPIPSAPPTRIRRIVIQVVEVFDPERAGENRVLHRVVNALHVHTREETLRRELLFHEGDVLDEQQLAETERNLRALAFLRSAEITTTPTDEEGLVDVLVRVQDNWTTRASYRLGRSGGHTRGSVAAQERNLLGLGKRLEFRYETNQDRSRNTFEYEDPQLFGTKFQLDAAHQVSSDGTGDLFSLQRPFRSLDARWSAGGFVSRNLETTRIYSGGEVLGRFDKQLENARAFYGWSAGMQEGVVDRFTVGWLYNSSRYTPQPLPKTYPDDQLPVGRLVSGPFVNFRRERSDWIKVRNFIRIERTEDFNLGSVFEIETTLSTKTTGGRSTRLIRGEDGAFETQASGSNQLLLDASLGRGFRMSPQGVLFARGLLDGRFGTDNDDETLLGFESTYYNNRLKRQTLVGHFRLDYGFGLDPTDRLLLGGDEGLRGFNSRILDGDRRFLLILEDRLWTKRELLHLFYVGAAAFIDAGNAWGGPLRDGFGQVHADAGVGVRFDASRSAHGGLLRLDVAYPFAGDRHDGPAIQFSFGHGLGY